jgi:serine/threonine-protein kinase RsbW
VGNAASGTVWERSWTIDGDLSAMRSCVEEVHSHLLDSAWDEAASFAVRLALEEALTNALRHGHGGDASLPIQLACRIGANAIHLDVEDQGPGFEPEAVPDPTADENLTIASGRGLALMRAFMSEVVVTPPGNRISMRLDKGCLGTSSGDAAPSPDGAA